MCSSLGLPGQGQCLLTPSLSCQGGSRPGPSAAWWAWVGLPLDPPGPAFLSPFGPRKARPFSWRGEHGFGHRMPPICRHLMGGLTKGHPEFVFVDTIKDHLFLTCGFFSLTWGGVGLPPLLKVSRPWVSRIAIRLCQFILSSFEPEIGILGYP